MRAIGDIRDTFIKKNNKWYERHWIGRYIFTGQEEIKQSAIFSNGYFTALIGSKTLSSDEAFSDTTMYVKSNSFVGTYRTILTTISNAIALSDTNNVLFYSVGFNSIAGLKDYLAEQYANGTPVYVDYISEEPLDLPCTPEQIQQLENKPSTYKDFTIIQSQDETPAYLEVAGIYDLNNLINN